MVYSTEAGVFKDKFEYLANKYWPDQSGSDDLSSGRVASLDPRTDAGQQDIDQWTKVQQRDEIMKERSNSPPGQGPSPNAPDLKRGHKFIDNEHHVPLIASAIMGEDGNMTGLAIDHRVKVPDEYLPHLALHESTELPLMHDYMADGMKEQDAYHKAHDIATAVESASVRGHAARNGLDPDAYHGTYQRFFRMAAPIAAGPSPHGRCPDCHTTAHSLDEAELGHNYDNEDYHHTRALTHLATEIFGPQHPILQVNPLEGQQGITSHEAPAVKPTPKITINRIKYGEESRYQRYQVNQDGRAVGTVSFSNYGGGHYHLNYAGGARGFSSNDLGTSVVRKVFKEFIKDNPDATRVSALRISGGRARAGQTGNIDFNVVNGKLKLREESKRDPDRPRSGYSGRSLMNAEEYLRQRNALRQDRMMSDLARTEESTFQGFMRQASGEAPYYHPIDRFKDATSDVLDKAIDSSATASTRALPGFGVVGMVAGDILDTSDRGGIESEEAETERRSPFNVGTEPVRYLR